MLDNPVNQDFKFVFHIFTEVNMDCKELKSELLSQIEVISHNENLLQKALSYVTELSKPNNYIIGKNGKLVGKQIKQYKSIIVPVVCDDMFEYIDDTGISHTLNDFVCETYKDFLDDDIKNAILSNLYYGISLYERETDDSLCSQLYVDMENAVNNGQIKLKECIKKFLLNGNFPVIITTIGFPVIEKIFNKEINLPEWYKPSGKNDLPLKTDNGFHTIYHIFGGETSTSWAYNEQTLMRFVHALHSGDYGAKNLSNYLCGNGHEASKRLLVLGSTLPDWLFRFFVYPMYEDKIKDAIGYWLSLSEIEKGLDAFLNRNKYSGQTNLRQGNKVEDILAEAALEDGYQDNKSVPNNYKIFVSYKREHQGTPQAEMIERVIDILKKQGVVWRDTEKVADGGNPYWANIKKAVKNCNLFVPLVTSRYLADYVNAANIDQIAEQPILDAEDENTNDTECIWKLKPVIREAYYAIAYNKKTTPIIVLDEKADLDRSTIERIFNDSSDNRKLPTGIFGEKGAKTYLEHNDKLPDFFDLPIID